MELVDFLPSQKPDLSKRTVKVLRVLAFASIVLSYFFPYTGFFSSIVLLCRELLYLVAWVILFRLSLSGSIRKGCLMWLIAQGVYVALCLLDIWLPIPGHVWLITRLLLPVCWIYGLSFLSNSPNLYRATGPWIGVLGLFTVIGYPTNILWLVASELLHNQPFALLNLLHIILQILMLIAYYKIIFSVGFSGRFGYENESGFRFLNRYVVGTLVSVVCILGGIFLVATFA